MAGAMAGGGGGGGDMSGGFDPSAGAGGAMGAGSNPLMQFLMSGSIGQKMRQAQMQQMQMQQLQQTQRAGAEAGNTLKAWAQGGGQGGPMPAPGGNAPPPQPVAPGVGSPPAAPAGGAPGPAGAPPGPPMPPMLQRAAFGGPQQGVGGGGREGASPGQANYGAPPGMPQAPQMQQAPMPPPRPPGLGTNVPPVGRGAPQSPMSLASQAPNATGFPGKSTPLMAQKAPPGAAGILRNAQGPGMGSIGAGPGTRFGSSPGGPALPGGAPPPASAKGPANAAESRANILADAQKSKAPGSSYESGTVSLPGSDKSYHWGSGSPGGARHIPAGDYPITPKTVGPWGASHDALGINNNAIYDPSEGRTRRGIELHPSSSDTVDKLYTAGCFAIAKNEYPEFKAKLLEATQKGTVYLHIGEDGKAAIDFKTNADGLAQGSKTFARAAQGAKTPAEGINKTPEGKAALGQAQAGQLDLRTAVRMFIATNPNAKPGDMIPALKELLPFMNEESQAENRKLQAADREERLKETETYHREQTADREQRQQDLEEERKARREDRATTAEDKKKAAEEKITQKNKEEQDKLDKQQADRVEKLDKDYENQLNNLNREVTTLQTGMALADEKQKPAMQTRIDALNKKIARLDDQGAPSSRKSAGKGDGDAPTKKLPLPESTKKELEGLDPNDPQVQAYKKKLQEKYDLGL